MAPIGSEHRALRFATESRHGRGGRRTRLVWAKKNRCRLSDLDEPQPDVMLLKPQADRWQTRPPQPNVSRSRRPAWPTTAR